MTYTVDQWQNMYCDLSSMPLVSVEKFELVYDNNYAGTPGNFVAFFDSIELINPTYSDTIVNGGFEEPYAPFGWAFSGVVSMISSPTADVQSGNQSLRLGTSVPAGDLGTTTALDQQFRVPNTNLSGYMLFLSFYLLTPGPSCQSNCLPGNSVTATLIDLTTGSNLNIATVTSGWSNTWNKYTVNLQSDEGDVVTLAFQTLATQGYTMFTYVDTIQVMLNGVTLTESEGTAASGVTSGTVTIPSGSYHPLCGSANTVYNIPLGLGSTNSKWADLQKQGGSYPAESNVTLGLNLWNLTDYCSGSQAGQDVMHFGATIAANGTGNVYSGGVREGVVGVEDLCILDKFNVVSGDAAVAPVYTGRAVFGIESNNVPAAVVPWMAQNSPDGLTYEGVFDIIAHLLISDIPLELDPATVFAVAIEAAFLLMLYYDSEPTPVQGSCANPPSTYSMLGYWQPGFDPYLGTPPTLVQTTGELDVHVGCDQSGCNGGTYTLSVLMIGDICQEQAYAQCTSTLFESVWTFYTMTIVTT